MRFLADLTKFKIELEQRQDAVSEAATTIDLMEPCPDDHLCCMKLERKLQLLEIENASLRADLQEFKDQVNAQFAKFDNPLTTPMQPGDRVLEGKWVLRNADVTKSASDQSIFDFASLVEKVFPRGFLTQFKSVERLPTPVRNACNIVIGKPFHIQIE